MTIETVREEEVAALRRHLSVAVGDAVARERERVCLLLKDRIPESLMQQIRWPRVNEVLNVVATHEQPS